MYYLLDLVRALRVERVAQSAGLPKRYESYRSLAEDSLDT